MNKLSPAQIGIVILALATGLIHLVVLNILMVNVTGGISILFTLNGLGFLSLLAAYFLPIPFLARYKSWIRWAFIAYTALTILAWIPNGARSALGYITKLIEIGLIVLLWTDRK
jgi:hypothetical protein